MIRIFNGLFGKKQTIPEISINDPINEIKDKITFLDMRINLVSKKIQEENTKAKNFLEQKNKERALGCLKHKRLYDEQLKSIMSQKMNLETLMIKLEESYFHRDTVQSIANTTQIMKNLNNDIKIETVEKIIDEMKDQLDNIKDVGNILSEPITNDIIDEDELWENFLDEKLEEDVLKPLHIPSEIPQAKHAPPVPTEEEEFEALERELAI